MTKVWLKLMTFGILIATTMNIGDLAWGSPPRLVPARPAPGKPGSPHPAAAQSHPEGFTPITSGLGSTSRHGSVGSAGRNSRRGSPEPAFTPSKSNPYFREPSSAELEARRKIEEAQKAHLAASKKMPLKENSGLTNAMHGDGALEVHHGDHGNNPPLRQMQKREPAPPSKPLRPGEGVTETPSAQFDRSLVHPQGNKNWK